MKRLRKRAPLASFLQKGQSLDTSCGFEVVFWGNIGPPLMFFVIEDVARVKANTSTASLGKELR